MKHLYYVLTARCNEVCAICPRSDAARVKDADPEQVLTYMRGAVDRFVKDAEQFDDLTMLCLAYRRRAGKGLS